MAAYVGVVGLFNSVLAVAMYANGQRRPDGLSRGAMLIGARVLAVVALLAAVTVAALDLLKVT